MKEIKNQKLLSVVEQLKLNLNGLTVKQLEDETEFNNSTVKYLTKQLKKLGAIKSKKTNPLMDQRNVIYYIGDD